MRPRLATPPLVLLVATLLATMGAPAHAGDEAPREYRVKAAFIQRFLEFVTWTGEDADPNGPVWISVVGDSPMPNALRDLAGESGAGREMILCSEKELPGRGCRVVFISATIDGAPRVEHPEWGDLRDLAAAGVLTIGEDPGFHLSGGVIDFFAQGDRLRFSVSEKAASSAGLKISSKLMRLALIVE